MGQLKNSEKIFNNDFKLVESAYKISQILDSTVPQIVFFGRSNVGKSSLINAVLNRKDLAKTSKTPGRTASVNYYSNSFKNFLLVDLPGYGFNRDNKALSGSWENLMLSFLKNSNILRAFILVD